MFAAYFCHSANHMWSISYLCTYELYGPVRNVFDTCISITRASGRELGIGALEIKTFLGPVKWHRAVRRVPFLYSPESIYRAGSVTLLIFKQDATASSRESFQIPFPPEKSSTGINFKNPDCLYKK
jgi:hypothetical protein